MLRHLRGLREAGLEGPQNHIGGGDQCLKTDNEHLRVLHHQFKAKCEVSWAACKGRVSLSAAGEQKMMRVRSGTELYEERSSRSRDKMAARQDVLLAHASRTARLPQECLGHGASAGLILRHWGPHYNSDPTQPLHQVGHRNHPGHTLHYPVPLQDDGNMPDLPSYPQEPQGPSLEWLKKP